MIKRNQIALFLVAIVLCKALFKKFFSQFHNKLLFFFQGVQIEKITPIKCYVGVGYANELPATTTDCGPFFTACLVKRHLYSYFFDFFF